MKIKEALSHLDPANDEHWTADGLPRMDAIVELLGGDTSVTRKDVTDAVPGLTREVAQAQLVTGATGPTLGDDPLPAAAPEFDLDTVDVLSLPMADVLGNPELTELAGVALNDKATALLKKKAGVEEEIRQVYAKCGIVERRKIMHDRTARRLGLKKTNVQDYLAAQATARAERAARARRFIEAGTTAGDVAEQLRGSSKIDTALRQRKPAPGSTRPALRVPAGR
jgi:hypothetical protein